MATAALTLLFLSVSWTAVAAAKARRGAKLVRVHLRFRLVSSSSGLMLAAGRCAYVASTDLNIFRNRTWAPAIEASGARTPARIYDLRSTFASNALAAGISVFELARVMGTSVEMIERHYGALLDGSGASMATRLGAFEAEKERVSTRPISDVE
jgi:hypothetical protein